MSIGFQLFKTTTGWRLTDEYSLDITHWSIEYHKDRIICRPTPLDLVYSVLGTVLFFWLATSILLMIFNPSWFFSHRLNLRPSGASTSRLLANTGLILPLASAVSQEQRSKYQKDPADIEEIRRATDALRESMMADMDEGQRAEFMQKASRIDQPQPASRSMQKFDRILDVLFLIGKIVCVFVAALSGLIGLACLRRALLFFRNRLEIQVGNRNNPNLILSRPKLFGGVSTQTYALADLAWVCCRPIVRQGVGSENDDLPDVVWAVLITTNSKDGFPLEFKVEHSVMASAQRPTAKTKKLANRLSRMTGLPLMD